MEQRKHPAQKAAEQVLKSFPQTTQWASRQLGKRQRLPGCLLSSADVLNQAILLDKLALKDLTALSALQNILAWRYSQSIYRFDPDLYREITATELDKAIPVEAFLTLPSWGLFIETQNFPHLGSMRAHGFFVSLSDDSHFKGYGLELRITYLVKDRGKLLTMPIPLTGGSVRDCISALQASAKRNLLNVSNNFAREMDESYGAELDINEAMIHDLAHCMALVLYLCSDQPDTDAPRAHALPKANKQGVIQPPPLSPKVWDVGIRFGQAYRRHQAASQTAAAADHNPGGHKRPHVRRAHWHGYWYGSKDGDNSREFRLRWLSPVMVGGKVEDMPATIVPVK